MDFKQLKQDGEYYALVVIAALGLGLMAASNDLIMLYLAMELTSITQYLLVGYLRDTPRSSEAGMKYFLFGAVNRRSWWFESVVWLYRADQLFCRGRRAEQCGRATRARGDDPDCGRLRLQGGGGAVSLLDA
jgi:hypothetical protein